MPESTAPPLPVVREGNVLAVLPAFVRQSDTAEVRDALVAGLTAILLRYQELAGYTASQCDIATATDIYLDGLCEDGGVFRQPGESDDALRARALTTPELVTPSAILAAANSILARYTAVQAQYAESVLDRWFISNGGARWHSFVGANPASPSRLYPEHAVENGGFLRPNSKIGGAWVFGDRLGRYFILRVPVLTALNRSHSLIGAKQTFVFDGAASAERGGRAGLFVFRGSSSALGVYQSIANAVNRIRAHSIRWQLIADPKLRG